MKPASKAAARVCKGVFAVGTFTSACAHHSVAQEDDAIQRIPVYAYVVHPETGGDPVRSPFLPLEHSYSHKLPVMQFCGAGAEGIVLVGGGVIGEEDGPWTPTTPYAAKISALDGHVLWAWQPQPNDPPNGSLSSLAVDAAGDVIVLGSSRAEGSAQGAFLLAKLDGAAGQLIWRVTGPEQTSGSAVAVDAAGDVLMTAEAPDGQRVAKYAGVDGSPIWSSTMEDGNTSWDDFTLVVDASGDAIAGGYWNSGQFGLQVGKFRGRDGAELWRYRQPSEQFDAELEVLRVTRSGDVLFQAYPDGLIRLAGSTGRIVWQRINEGGVLPWEILVDATDRIFISGRRYPETNAVVARVDPMTGATLWTSEPPPQPTAQSSAVTHLGIGYDGQLVAAWSALATEYLNLGGANIDPESGEWTHFVRFGNTDPLASAGETVGVLAEPGGGFFVGTRISERHEDDTWTLFELPGHDERQTRGHSRHGRPKTHWPLQ
jgi:outer membrane protein assembly factor BamB